MTIDPAGVAHNVEVVRGRIRRAGGDRPVELIAVTKTFPVEAILAAVAAGCRSIGENYAQELVAKLEAFDQRTRADGAAAATVRPEVHFIGRLQSNKVRHLVGLVDVFQTVDRASLVEELARRAPGARCFVQVNVSGEPQKGGCEPSGTPALVASARAAGLVVEGLMTVAEAGDPASARPGFRRLRALADELGLAGCSMGMSGDLEIAVEEGATHVRVGSALFGPRVRQTVDRAR